MTECIPCGKLIKLLHDRLEKQANNALRADGLTMMQIAVLMELQTSEQQLSMKDLEHRFGVAQSTVAGIISRLEQKGFVEAVGDPADKRVKIARITAAGMECCKSAACHMDEAEEQLLKGFSLEDRNAFRALLAQAAENMK